MQKYTDDDTSSTQPIRRSHSDRTRKKEIKHRERHSEKKYTKTEGERTDLLKGKALQIDGAYVIVETAPNVTTRARTIKSTISGNVNASLIAVGDVVMLEQAETDISVIREVLPRKNKLSRLAHKKRNTFEQVIAANIDLVGIVSGASEPPFRPGLVDKYIVAALEENIGVLIILNKADQLETDDRKEFILEALTYYQTLGYPSAIVSAETGEGIDELRDMIKGKTIVFAGKSGVGKSSLLNKLFGEEIARTQGLTKKSQRGMHTTTYASIIAMPDHQGYVVDTPGIKEFFHFDLDPTQIKFHFVEFLPLQLQCQMTGCLHIHEPGCAVSEAVDDEIIPEWRYNSYVSLWEEAERERKSRIGGI